MDPRGWSPSDRFVAVAILASLIAPVTALVGAILNGWAPNGDDATVALRAADVLDGRLPLTGMRSTAGDGVDPELATHHLGPVQFYLLALPLALTGGSAVGIALGGALVAGTASVLTVIWARRLGGTLGVAVFTGGLLLAQWAIGPEAMFRPLNPYPPLLPAYLALLLLWALARDKHRALPPFVVAVSILAQGNLAFLPLAGLLTLAAVGLTLLLRREAGRGRRRAGRSRRLSHRWALGLGLLAWLPSLAELLVHQPNNLQQLVRWATSETGEPIGLVAGLEHLSLIAPAPGGFRRYTSDLLTTGSALGTVLGVVVLLLLVAISTGWRVPQGRASSAWPARVALVGNLGMVVTASRLPEWPAAPYWVIVWLPVAAFTWAALVWRGLAYVEDASPRLPRKVSLRVAPGLVAAAIGAATLGVAPDWDKHHAMTAVAESTVDGLGRGDGRPLRINGLGFIPTLGAAPAVAWQAHRAGWEPHYMRPWIFDEDAEHLWSGTAPEGAQQVFIVDSTQPDLQEGVPEDAEEIASVDQQHRDGTITVYRAR